MPTKRETLRRKGTSAKKASTPPARAAVKVKPDESEAAVAIARAWLAKAGFHEDPDGTSPERIEIQGPGWNGERQDHYVDVRVYIPAIDIEHVVDGTHPDGIRVDEAP